MDVVSMQQRALSFLSSSASSSAVSRCLHIPPRFCVGVWVSVCSIYKYIAAADAAVLMTGIKYLQRSLKGPFSRAVSLSLFLSHSLATEGFSCRPTTLVARRRTRVSPATG